MGYIRERKREKKAKKQTKPQIPKASKPKSGLLPPNAKKRKAD